MDRSKTFEQLQQDVYAYLDGELEPNDMASYDELIQSDKRAKEFVDEIVVFEGHVVENVTAVGVAVASVRKVGNRVRSR